MYDLAIIGAGWAGFNAAIEAKKLDKSVCLIEKENLGGTCLNRGCIPTKILIHFAKKFSQNSHPDISLFKKEQQDIVAKLRQGMEFVLKSKKVDFIKGTAKIISKNRIVIKENNQEVEAKFILIAVGSKPKDLPFLKFDRKNILSSDDILIMDAFPQSLLIVGGGVIGCEFASVLNKLGVKVTIAEVLERLVFMFDKDISSKLEQSFNKSGITVHAKCDVKTMDLSLYDKILLSVGRKIDMDDLFDADLGIDLTKDGYIKVDKNLKTNLENIYAAGDCIGGMQLAHVASYEAKVVVNNIFVQPIEPDYTAIPSSVFTFPELAQVGINEEEAKKQNKNIKVIKKLFSSVGMAHIFGETEGFLKLIVDKDNDTVIGAGIIGPLATELLNTLTIAIKYKLTLENLKDLVFAHPSISEIFTEAIHS